MGAPRPLGEARQALEGEGEALLREDVEVDGDLGRGVREGPGGEDGGGAEGHGAGGGWGEAGGGGCGGPGTEARGWRGVAGGGYQVVAWVWVGEGVPPRGLLRKGVGEGEGSGGVVVDCVGIWVAGEAGVGAGLGASAVVSGRVLHFEVVESVGGGSCYGFDVTGEISGRYRFGMVDAASYIGCEINVGGRLRDR